jgi:hypothetical protein
LFPVITDGSWFDIAEAGGDVSLREKITKGIIGAAGFPEQMDKKVIETKRPRRIQTKKIVCYNLISQNNIRNVPDLRVLE